MDKIKRVEESEVFKRSHQFTLLIYKIKNLPILGKVRLGPTDDSGSGIFVHKSHGREPLPESGGIPAIYGDRKGISR